MPVLQLEFAITMGYTNLRRESQLIALESNNSLEYRRATWEEINRNTPPGLAAGLAD